MSLVPQSKMLQCGLGCLACFSVAMPPFEHLLSFYQL